MGIYLNPGNDGLAKAAIQQIKNRQYPQAHQGYSGEILLTGVNYEKENKKNLISV